MDVHDKLDEIMKYVESARAMPMSSSSVVNRTELLGQLHALRDILPATLQEADQLLDEREQLLAQARSDADALVLTGQEERALLVAEHEVLTEAQTRAEETLTAAAERADELRREVDDYVDAKLAHLELAVEKILETVRRGRDRLSRTSAYAELADTEASERDIGPGAPGLVP
jgi:cell division septum initiation protein DivIVA